MEQRTATKANIHRQIAANRYQATLCLCLGKHLANLFVRYCAMALQKNTINGYCRMPVHHITLQPQTGIKLQIDKIEMNKTIVIYGSSTGVCQSIAEKIGRKLNAEVLDVQNLDSSKHGDYDSFVIGTSTWGAGELQDDWYDGLKTLHGMNLNGKTIAIFGCGDCESYGDTFVNAMGELYNALKDSGATFVGSVPVDGYSFSDSEAVIDGSFVGLALDEINEADKTDSRINAWVESIKDRL